MQFNWLDYVLLGIVATVAAVQFLRSVRDFSRILYETLLMVGAVAAATRLVLPLQKLTGLGASVLFGGVGFVLVIIAIILAALSNRLAPLTWVSSITRSGRRSQSSAVTHSGTWRCVRSISPFRPAA